MAIDYGQIGNEPDKIYRPYLWFGEEHDAHITEFRSGQAPTVWMWDGVPCTENYHNKMVTQRAQDIVWQAQMQSPYMNVGVTNTASLIQQSELRQRALQQYEQHQNWYSGALGGFAQAIASAVIGMNSRR